MTNVLFRDANLSDVLTGQEQAMSREIESLDEARVLNTSPEDLCDYFVEKYRVDAIEINESGIQADYGDARVDVSNRFEYGLFDRGLPTYVTGTRVTFYVPFSGDSQLFKYRPSRFTLNPLRADVRGNELVFVYDRTTQEAPNIRSEFERDLKNVKDHIVWIASEVHQFNSASYVKRRPNKWERVGINYSRTEGLLRT